MNRFYICMVVGLLALSQVDADDGLLQWSELPPLPDELGVAGPFVGVHHDALIVAGGANFPRPVWENDKQWHDSIHVLVRDQDDQGQDRYTWKDGGKLPRPIAYGAAVSTDDGVVCIGGNDSRDTFAEVFLLAYDRESEKVTITDLPSLPHPCAFSSATLVENRIYLGGGQRGQSLETATSDFWSLDLSQKEDASFAWVEHNPMPGPTRALHITATQHNGDHDAVYVISGRRQAGETTEFLKDVWEFTPATGKWRQRRDSPRCLMAGVGIGVGQTKLLVLGGADGSLFYRGDELRDQHPGFPKEALVYQTVTDTWSSAGPIPANHVTTIAVRWDDAIIVPSGEVRPRVRSAKIWKVTGKGSTDD